MITLRQLQCLIAVSETLHFGKAAERCHITQPAFSSQIRQLEDMLGVLLVERTRHRVLMTPLGSELVQRATRILREVADFTEAARESSKPFNGTLRLGILPTLGPYLLPHILPVLRQRYGDLKLYLREEPANRLRVDLARGDIDAMLISLTEGEGPYAQALFHEPLWAALPLNHRLASATTLDPGDLAGEELLLLEEGHCLRDQALALCVRVGAAEHTSFRATSLDSLRQMVATGLGMTLLPALYVAAEALDDDQIAMRPFRDTPERLIGMVWRPSGAHADEFRKLADLIRDNLPKTVIPAGGGPPAGTR
ncbi:LysR substrate-binding domain-containing protein [Telmatospirillum siberiense]|uniref:Hydrogen peroxide-inducible genes activator n=1 Tax=Telmatospirillum siberiense TaxID=382514 RepID=A0A2N3PYZ9_9PROT|nr:LysR substrate-binding domain-containing protein [Telmatospirillum siberiense]PKU25642.1 hydrogen peroxide-inducible genes activator [Telmatospirillum siberiense]